MKSNSLDSRRHRHFQLSSAIAQLGSVSLERLSGAWDRRSIWGSHKPIEIDGRPVFVKRIPVTDVEYESLFSTANLYDLPMFYNYGVGSCGMGVFRELVSLIKTTNWVLDGKIETFPLLYHYRIVSCKGEREPMDPQRHQGYVEYWAGNENVGRYMLDRTNARHELILFLEHIPHVLHTWLKGHPGRIDAVLDDLHRSVGFLNDQGIIHFDAHFHNALTDGGRVYLTDFGLSLDRGFALTEVERAFQRAHMRYDIGQILSCLDCLLYFAYAALPTDEQGKVRATYGLEEDIKWPALMPVLLANIESLHADGILRLHERALACVLRYRDIVRLMRDFHASLTSSNRKDAVFPQAELRRRLRAAGLL